MTVSEAWKYGASELAGQPEAALDARLLLEKAAGISLERFLTEPDALLCPDAEELYRDWIRRRKNREPAAYILNEQEFMGLRFYVTKDTLIPNPDTEILTETALDVLSGENAQTEGDDARRCGTKPHKRILDLCTGTGCILLSILKLFPDWGYKNLKIGGQAVSLSGTGTDLSEKALAVARENARRLEIENCRFLQGDLFSALQNDQKAENGASEQDLFDMIVSNPPYVKPAELAFLEPEVREYEPEMALLGGEDGLSFYRRIAEESPRHLKPSGKLIMEIGAEQGEDVVRLLRKNGFTGITVKKDLSGKDRVVLARFR